MSSYNFFGSAFTKQFQPILRSRKDQARRYQLEALESRFVPTVSAVFSSGLLTITGDSSANDIDVTYSTISSVDYLIVISSGGTILDGTPTGSNIAASAVDAINVDAGDGADSVDLSAVTAANGFSGLNDETNGLDNEITITGGNGTDTLVGSAFGDIINGGGGDDSLSGGAGNDLYVYLGSSLGSDVINEASDIDSDWIYFGFFGAGVTINLSNTSAQNIGGSTTITLSNSTGIENLVGSGFSDSLTGSSRDNTLQGAAGNDTLAGGIGNDFYIFHNGDGSDSITESSGLDFDTIDFSGASSGVTIDLSSTSTQTWVSGSSIVLSSSTGIEQVIGSTYADSLTGNSRDNGIIGAAGNDTLVGGAGNDYFTFLNGDGSDTVTESSDSDFDTVDFSGATSGVTIDLSSTSSQTWVSGSSIVLSSSTGIEQVIGSTYADSLTGNSRDNYITGGGGNDSMIGGSGSDFYIFNSDAGESDLITEAAGLDSDVLYFWSADVDVTIDISTTSAQNWGNGTITLSSTTSIEGVYGGRYDDTIVGNSESNFIFGNSGNNILDGGSGGADSLYGGIGNDELTAGPDSSFLSGSFGNDTIYGGNGNDTIEGGSGDDSLIGGAGDDLYDFSGSSSGTDSITETSNVDQDILNFYNVGTSVILNISNTSAQNWGGGTLTLSSATGIEVVIGANAYSNTLTGNSRDNVLYGSISSVNTLSGNDGNDVLVGGIGNDTLDGGDGRDLLSGSFGSDSLSGGDGDDVIISGFAVFPGNISDVVDAVEAVLAEWADGTSYSVRVDNITAAVGASNPLPSGERLQEGETIFDDLNVDTLTGGNDDDLFFYDNGEDVITDLQMGESQIDIG